MGHQRLLRLASPTDPVDRVPWRDRLGRWSDCLYRCHSLRVRFCPPHARGSQREPLRLLRLGRRGDIQRHPQHPPCPRMQSLSCPETHLHRRASRPTAYVRGPRVVVVADLARAQDALLPRHRFPRLFLADVWRHDLLDIRYHRAPAHTEQPVQAGRKRCLLGAAGCRRHGLHRLSYLFMVEVQPRWYMPAPGVLGWHIGLWNLIGAIGFTLCGALGFAISEPAVEYALTLSTFIGSWAFLVSGAGLALSEPRY